MVNAVVGELAGLGYTPFFAEQLAQLGDRLVPARIAVAHGESYVAWTASGPCKAIIAGKRLMDWETAVDRPQVGDWVAGEPSEELAALIIEHRLERRTCLVRQASSRRPERQVIAANVDVVGVVSALDEGHDAKHERWLINEPRLSPYLTAIEQSGARPLLVVNKSDLHPDPGLVVTRLSQVFPKVPVVALSAAERSGMDGLAPWLGRGETLVLVGMSGVGKSTLVNALLGREAQRVGGVRERDGRGRHTTSHRELSPFPAGRSHRHPRDARDDPVGGRRPGAPARTTSPAGLRRFEEQGPGHENMDKAITRSLLHRRWARKYPYRCLARYSGRGCPAAHSGPHHG